MIRHTKAAYLKELGRPLVVDAEIEIPDLKRGQILVKIAYSGICRSQLMEIKGHRGPDRYLPHMLGHEATGEVLEIGEGVTKVGVGDWVILGWIQGEGLDGGGTRYKKEGLSIQAGGVTSFMTHSVVSENRVVKLPKEIPPDQGVLLGCAVPTGTGIVINLLRPEPNSKIAIFGLGGIGLCALMATQAFRPNQVIAVDVDDEKLHLAKELGATDCINSKNDSPVETIHQLTGGKGVDYSIEAIGNVQVIEQAFQSVKKGGGRCVFAGHPPHGSRISLDPFDLISGKRIEGTWGGASHPDQDIEKFRELFKQGRLPLEKLLSHRYSLENINQAFEDLQAGRVRRALLEM